MNQHTLICQHLLVLLCIKTPSECRLGLSETITVAGSRRPVLTIR